MSKVEKNKPGKNPNTDTPKPQKQWDEMPKRTSDPEQQQIERVIEEGQKNPPKGNAGEVGSSGKKNKTFKKEEE